MKKKTNAGVNTKQRLHKRFLKKTLKPRKRVLKRMKLTVIKSKKKKFRRKKSNKNIKIYIKTSRLLSVITKGNPRLNKFRHFFMMYTKRRIWFRKKPYHYKLRKLRQPRWLFKHNRKKFKRFSLQTPKSSAKKRLVRKNMLKAIKTQPKIIRLLKLKKLFLKQKHSNAPLIITRRTRRKIKLEKRLKERLKPLWSVIKKRAGKKYSNKKRKTKFRKKARKPKSKMKLLLKRIKVISRYKQ